MAGIKSKFNSEKIFYLVLMLVVIVLLYDFYSKLESHLVEEDKGYQGEALTNDYLAAEYFLLQMGQNAEKLKLFSTDQKSLNKNDILLVPSIRLSFDRRRTDDMLEWLKNGGHLIITGDVDSEKIAEHKDYLLNSLGLKVDRKALASESETSESEASASVQSDYPVNIMSFDDEMFLQVDFDDYLILSKTPEFNSDVLWEAEDEDRIHGIQIRVGEGTLTLLSDMRMFTNDYIDAYDHAAFLLSLIQSQQSTNHSNTFYYSLYEERLSLIQWLWENAHLLMLSFIVLIVSVLWMIAPRFGPLINVGEPVQRQFLKHLSAAGNYHWRQGNYVHLLSDVRVRLSHEVKIKYPEWVNLSKQDQIKHFSGSSQLEVKQVEMALFNTDIQHVNDFITTIKLLEMLRKNL